MKKNLISFISLLSLLMVACTAFGSCSPTDNTGGKEQSTLLYGNLEEGDMLFENFRVIKVKERTTVSLYSYEVVDLTSGVVYLYSYWSNGNGTTCTMTPLYNSDGSVRTHGGNN